MLNHLKRHAERRVVRYIVVGGSAYVFEMASLIAMDRFTNLSSVQLVAVSFWIGLLYAFTAQKLVTFKDKSRDLRVLRNQTGLYILLVGWNYLFTLGVTRLLSDILPVLFIRTLVILIITVWNYQIYKYIFKNEEENTNKLHKDKEHTQSS